MIESSDISILLQGPFYNEITIEAIDSARKFLPNAEIILSTWEKQNLPLLIEGKVDKLIMTADPGPGYINKAGIPNNVNRQLVSTKAGLPFCSRKYLLKIRSDLQIVSLSFLNEYEKYKIPADLFHQKLLALDFYTRNCRVLPMPFHLSDWILFGLVEDVKEYYESIPLQSKEDDEWFLNHVKGKEFCFVDLIPRLAPEQHFLVKFLEIKDKTINCRHYCDNNEENKKATEKVLARNFCIVDCKGNFKFLKYNPNRGLDKGTLISNRDWLRLNKFYERGEKTPYVLFLVSSGVKRFFEYNARGLIIRAISILGLKSLVKSVLYKLTDR